MIPCLVVALLLCTFALAPAATIDVPADHATIQAAINAATVGDEILVAPGTYLELLTLKSNVAVLSSGGADVTVIDAAHTGSVVTGLNIHDVTLEGFTIQNGEGSGGNSSHQGGGLMLTGCGPSVRIQRNIIRANRGWDGGGVSAWLGLGAVFDSNIFEGNEAYIDAGVRGLGGAIFVYNTHPQITKNIFRNNQSGRGGSAIAAFESSEPDIIDNIFYDNHDLNVTPEYNGTIAIGLLSPLIRGNTFVSNTGGSVLSLFPGASPQLENNIFAFNGGTSVVVCSSGSSATFACCNIYGNAGGDWTGCAAAFLGVAGNVSADPQFCDFAADIFTLYNTSPCAAAQSGCGLMGALPVACGPVSLQDTAWAKIKGRFRSLDRE